MISFVVVALMDRLLKLRAVESKNWLAPKRKKKKQTNKQKKTNKQTNKKSFIIIQVVNYESIVFLSTDFNSINSMTFDTTFKMEKP